MKTKLLKLIKASKALDELQKQIYSKMLDFLSEDELKTLLKIFGKEAENTKETACSLEKKKAKFYESYIKKLDNFFKKEEKSAIAKEEESYKTEAEEILKDLNEI